MESINEVMLLGCLGADPEIKGEGDKARCRLSIATSYKYRDADKQIQQKTDWAYVIAWGKQAETISAHFRKGDWIWIRGRLTNRKYQKQDGTTAQTTEVVLQQFKFMSNKRTAAQSTDQAAQPAQASRAEQYQKDREYASHNDEDVPF